MLYLALLRGINVGGNNKIEMPRLKAMFEKLGFVSVLVYINTGNVIFEDKEKVAGDLVKILEKEIELEFSLSIKVVVKSFLELENICQKIPENWLNDAIMRTEVMFLWPEIDSPDILNQIKINPELDHLLYCPGALVWHMQKADYSQSKLSKFVSTQIYKKVTIRNVNTTRKLLQLMQNLS